jgi:hypothetical protein
MIAFMYGHDRGSLDGHCENNKVVYKVDYVLGDVLFNKAARAP